MFSFLYWIYFALFILACLCTPFLLVGFIINLLAKNKKLSIITITSFVFCVVICLSYATPDYSRAKFSDTTIRNVSKIYSVLDNGDIWETYPKENDQNSYICYWETDSAHVSVHVYPHKASLLNAEGELYIDKTINFLLFGKEEKAEGYHIIIYPKVIYRDFLKIVPDYSETQIEILNEGRVISVTMLNKTWDKKDDVAINEFLSDLFNDTDYGVFADNQSGENQSGDGSVIDK